MDWPSKGGTYGFVFPVVCGLKVELRNLYHVPVKDRSLVSYCSPGNSGKRETLFISECWVVSHDTSSKVRTWVCFSGFLLHTHTRTHTHTHTHTHMHTHTHTHACAHTHTLTHRGSGGNQWLSQARALHFVSPLSLLPLSSSTFYSFLSLILVLYFLSLHSLLLISSLLFLLSSAPDLRRYLCVCACVSLCVYGCVCVCVIWVWLSEMCVGR